ncbi:MAG: hypothetical protein C4533_05910 [Candidatus Omnitrophota bacterium]|jgi:hypothetical protein|nr:MAG: hypothetical protein C4533_05910 [Candidatus Omnitrophota bacterium]
MEEIKQPWLRGIIDTLTAANLIKHSKIEHRNRLVVILLDSALEIAFRSFLKRIKRIQLSEAHKHRENLVKAVQNNISFDAEVWDSINYYYEDIRCDFYHTSSDKTLTDKSLETYIELVEFVINSLLNIKCRDFILKPSEVMTTEGASKDQEKPIYFGDLKSDLEVFLVGVDKYNPSSLTELLEHLKKEGVRKKFTYKQFNNCVGANYRHLFYYDKSTKRWNLSSEGLRKLRSLKEQT